MTEDLDAFVHVINGHLRPISVPVDRSISRIIDPTAFDTSLVCRRNGQNLDQDDYDNVPAATSTYAVGGMITHWTCVIPRFNPKLEGINNNEQYIPDDLDNFYHEVEDMLNHHTNLFDHSLRHKGVKEILDVYYTETLGIPVQAMPMAGDFADDNVDCPWRRVKWTGADTIYKSFNLEEHLLTEHVVKKLEFERTNDPMNPYKVVAAIVKELKTGEYIRILADYFIVACNPILTGQLLWASGIGSNTANVDEHSGAVDSPENLPVGRFFTEHPVAFCQVILKKDIVDRIGQIAQQDGRPIDTYDATNMYINELPPNLWVPCSNDRPWHVVVHRDAYDYGSVPPNVDERVIVDMRWFGGITPKYNNWVEYRSEYHSGGESSDRLGMPQPTFHYTIPQEDGESLHKMFEEMTQVAGLLGGYLPGTEPKWLPPGTSKHYMGTTRIGKSNDGNSVVDENSRVWLFSNLFVGGGGVIPTKNFSNSTLTACAFAKKACDFIKILKNKK